MIIAGAVRRLSLVGASVALAVTGCAFDGLNSLPLPGSVGRGQGAATYYVEIANVSTLESNSPVMIKDVIVGSVGTMSVKNWHAIVEVSVEPGVVVPANVVASVGQTSLLGSMHMQLNVPPGQMPRGRLEPGATVPLNRASTYPSTERTLSALSAVVNGGGLGQIGDIIHNVNGALSGREEQIRSLLTRLDTFVGTIDDQRDQIVSSLAGLNRLAAMMAAQRDVIESALHKIPPALDVLIRERPRLTEALKEFGTFSDIAGTLVGETQTDLIRNLQNLGPTLRSLADVGPSLDAILAWVTTAPFTQNFIDRAVRGDYVNLFADFDISVPRLKRGLLLGTRWAQDNATLTPAPGEPGYLNYTNDPLGFGSGPLPPGAGGEPPAPATPSANGGG